MLLTISIMYSVKYSSHTTRCSTVSQCRTYSSAVTMSYFRTQTTRRTAASLILSTIQSHNRIISLRSTRTAKVERTRDKPVLAVVIGTVVAEKIFVVAVEVGADVFATVCFAVVDGVEVFAVTDADVVAEGTVVGAVTLAVLNVVIGDGGFTDVAATETIPAE